MPTTIFSPKQMDVLRLMIEEGLPDKEIGEAMGVKPHTIKLQRNQMYHRLQTYLGYKQLPHRIDLVLFAVTHELVDMRTIIDRYSPVPLTSARSTADGGPGPGTAPLRATAS